MLPCHKEVWPFCRKCRQQANEVASRTIKDISQQTIHDHFVPLAPPPCSHSIVLVCRDTRLTIASRMWRLAPPGSSCAW